jgi:hypothetical protein
MNTEIKTYPDLMAEQEVIEYLRISEVSKSKDYHNCTSSAKVRQKAL